MIHLVSTLQANKWSRFERQHQLEKLLSEHRVNCSRQLMVLMLCSFDPFRLGMGQSKTSANQRVHVTAFRRTTMVHRISRGASDGHLEIDIANNKKVRQSIETSSCRPVLSMIPHRRPLRESI